MSKTTEQLVAELQEINRGLRPTLLRLKEIFEVYIADVQRGPLFVIALPLPSGGHAVLPEDVDAECAQAVAAVLSRRLVQIEKALTPTIAAQQQEESGR